MRSSRHQIHRLTAGIGTAALGLLLVAGGAPAPASGSPTEVSTEIELKRAWQNPKTRAISVQHDIFLRACQRGSRSASHRARCG